MKHIKPYKIFESKEVIMAGIDNAIDKNNIELFKDLIEQYSEHIDFKKIKNHLSWESNNTLPFYEFIPSEHLANIKELDISYKGVESLKGIEFLYNLEKLSCRDTWIKSLKGIENLNRLKELNCSENKYLTSLEYLPKNLLYLKTRACSLESLKGIENCTMMTQLNCSDNSIETLKELSGLVDMEKLYVQYNQLTNLDGIQNMKLLYTFICTHNNLTTMKNIIYLDSLRDFHFGDNDSLPEEVQLLPDTSITLTKRYYSKIAS